MKRRLFTTLCAVLLTVCLAIGIAACGPTDSGDDTVKITLDHETLILSEGGSAGMIVATVKGSSETVAWEVSDDKIVSVTPLGNTALVNPVKEGEATLTASIGEVSATCEITVGPAAAVEVVTIFHGEENVTGTTMSVEEGKTLTLTATASEGSAIADWTSSNEAVATVEDGVITAIKPGTVEITALVTPSIKASVTVEVKAPDGTVYYDLQRAAEGGSVDLDKGEPIEADKYFYWVASQEYGMQNVVVEHAYFRDGVLNFQYTCDTSDGVSFGVQIFYKNSDHTVGNYYKMTCTIEVDVACTVTLNGRITELKAGKNTLEVYYQYTDGLHSGEIYGVSSFDLVMGYEDGTQKGVFVQNADIVVTDVEWEDITDSRITLEAPSFTYNAETGIIDISDPNKAGVGGYRLNLYKDGVLATSVAVENGEVVDMSRVANGTYTAKICAIAANTLYIDSSESADGVEITVANASIRYEIEASGESGAWAAPGEWTYFVEWWVTASTHEYVDGNVNFAFDNNSGQWRTQLFYRDPAAVVGEYYTITLTITSNASGNITVCGQTIEIKEGTHEYTLKSVLQSDNRATVVIGFGVSDEDFIKTASFTIATPVLTAGEAPEKPDLPEGEFGFGEETVAVANPDNMYYWNDQNWCGSNVTVTEAKVEDGLYTFTYSGMTPNCKFGFQLFYKNGANIAGETYTVSFVLVSEVAGIITVNGQIVEIEAGRNEISVAYTETETKASLSIQFGDNRDEGTTVIAEGTFTLSDLTFTGKNVDPNEPAYKVVKASLVVEDGKVYFVYSGSYANYTEADLKTELASLNFDFVWPYENWPHANAQDGFVTTFVFDADGTGTWAYRTEVTFGSLNDHYKLGSHYIDNSGGLDYLWTVGEYVEEGDYRYEFVSPYNGWGVITFEIKEIGAGGGDTPVKPDEPFLGENPADYELGARVEPSYVEIYNGAETKGDGDQHGSNVEKDAFHLWWQTWDNVVTMKDGWDTITDNTIAFTFSGGDQTWSIQLFYNNTELTEGKTYLLNINIWVSAAYANVTVNGVQFNLAQGDNEIHVKFVLGNGVSAIDIQFPATEERTVKISNISWQEVLGNKPSTEQPGETSAKIMKGTAADSVAHRGVWVYEVADHVTVTKAEVAEDGTLTFTYTGATAWDDVKLYFTPEGANAGETWNIVLTIMFSYTGDPGALTVSLNNDGNTCPGYSNGTEFTGQGFNFNMTDSALFAMTLGKDGVANPTGEITLTLKFTNCAKLG